MAKTSAERVADILSFTASSTSTAAGQGHDEFAELFATAYPSVVRTVRFITQDRAVAEEIAQEAFIDLLSRWSKVSRYDRPDLWVRRVAIRRAQRERRRDFMRPARERAGASAAPGPAEPGHDQELLEAVKTLPPKQRAIIVLFYYEDRAMDEIAELVGCSVSSGWSQLHNARKKLAFLLADEVTDDVR